MWQGTSRQRQQQQEKCTLRSCLAAAAAAAGYSAAAGVPAAAAAAEYDVTNEELQGTVVHVKETGLDGLCAGEALQSRNRSRR
jgi:diphthamide synthase (EF-2-diphthine--ammonia ligase)